jgi:aspartyl/asparaginyl beta-hydroxylase (cupin superfamily)
MTFEETAGWCKMVNGMCVPEDGKIRRFIQFCDSYPGMTPQVMDKTLKWAQRYLVNCVADMNGSPVARGVWSSWLP